MSSQNVVISKRLYPFATWSVTFLFPVPDEQFVLKRIADSAIDIYAMVVVLSRCINTSSQSRLPHVFIPHMIYVNVYNFLLCAELHAH